MYSGRKALIYIMQYLLMASQYYILQIKYCMYKKIKNAYDKYDKI